MLNDIPREEIYQVISSTLLFSKVFDQISAAEVYANYISISLIRCLSSPHFVKSTSLECHQLNYQEGC